MAIEPMVATTTQTDDDTASSGLTQQLLSVVSPLAVFNFHHVEPTLTKASRKHITITTQGFRQFIHTVRSAGFEPISLKALYQRPDAYKNLNRRFCLITFDDGLVNNFEHAWPVLEAEQCPATIFALPGQLGGTNNWDEGHLPESERDALMTAEQMQAMGQSPLITFCSHAYQHLRLSQLSRADIRHSLHTSHHELSKLLGSAYVPALAYPWGDYSDVVLQEMDESPYLMAFTTTNGLSTPDKPRHELPRYSVFFRDANPLLLQAKLRRHKLVHPLTGQAIVRMPMVS